MKTLLLVLLLAGTVTYTLSTSPDQVRFARFNGFDAVELTSGIVVPEPGKPCLPEVPVTLAIPATARVTGVTVVPLATTELGSHNVMPVQKYMMTMQIITMIMYGIIPAKIWLSVTCFGAPPLR